MTEELCPHWGHDVREMWHKHCGVQKLERGSGRLGFPWWGRGAEERDPSDGIRV